VIAAPRPARRAPSARQAGEGPVIVWFRRDLRLADNSAFVAAVASGRPIVPVYIWDEDGEGDWPEGGASRWWLHHSLAALGQSLSERGLRLVLRSGAAADELPAVAGEIGAQFLYWNFRYEPAAVKQQREVEAWAKAAEADITSRAFTSSLLFDPETIRNRQGGPFKVFSAYWRRVSSLSIPRPVKLPAKAFIAPKIWPKSLSLADLKLRPKLGWAEGWDKLWTPGEAGARRELRKFLRKIEAYDTARDVPGLGGSSRLSAHLHFGEIGPRQVFEAVRALSRGSGVFPVHGGAQKFLAELGWREFAYSVLHYFPETPAKPFHGAFAKLPWAPDPRKTSLEAWQRGKTGYPIVDAGMRELWATGWLPNRVRMIAASFLVKHLLQPWQLGAAWFWDTLVDADLANNTLGWQWIAGCGADASPFFRVFAPVTQAEKFDPKGEYVRRWVPELARLPDEFVHAPWTAPAEVLEKAGVVLGQTYPNPIVDHYEAHERALKAFRKMQT
jgi:deoxyribodipyrimidine photo-lyase